MTKPEAIRKACEIAKQGNIDDAFNFAHEHDVAIDYDWQTLYGEDFFTVFVGGIWLWFREESGKYVLCSESPEI